ncbi:hypothetical protein [Nonomuraea sp. NPDC049784]|uniref:hypothetical protein n=1 Tax=Nonomuraea sp. NPDC049784 TaxID=3154361 RepID=UPI0033FFF4E7
MTKSLGDGSREYADRIKRVSCELDLMDLDQPRYVVVNGWPEGSHLNEVMATRGGVCVGHFYT